VVSVVLFPLPFLASPLIQFLLFCVFLFTSYRPNTYSLSVIMSFFHSASFGSSNVLSSDKKNNHQERIESIPAYTIVFSIETRFSVDSGERKGNTLYYIMRGQNLPWPIAQRK
jgi:hypothetical protein